VYAETLERTRALSEHHDQRMKYVSESCRLFELRLLQDTLCDGVDEHWYYDGCHSDLGGRF
jgi:hypothetical protein